MSDDLARTYLDTSDGTAEYAKRNGAIFDKVLWRWYFLGEVPPELYNLIPKQKNSPAAKVVAPSCLRCGFHTVLLQNKKDNTDFWGCSQYRVSGCRGSIDYLDYLDSIDVKTPKNVSEILDNVLDEATPLDVTPKKPIDVDSEILAKRVEIGNLSIRIFGATQSEKWLTKPKVSLGGKTPIALMCDADRCEKVLELIRSCQ